MIFFLFSYVQHLIEQNGQLLADLIATKNVCIFVAGNSKNMPDSVRKAFISSYASYKCIDETAAENFFQQLEQKGRFQTETWS